jgi:hypothetical protein
VYFVEISTLKKAFGEITFFSGRAFYRINLLIYYNLGQSSQSVCCAFEIGMMFLQGCQMFISKPKIIIWVNFVGSCNGRCWYIL